MRQIKWRFGNIFFFKFAHSYLMGHMVPLVHVNHETNVMEILEFFLEKFTYPLSHGSHGSLGPCEPSDKSHGGSGIVLKQKFTHPLCHGSHGSHGPSEP